MKKIHILLSIFLLLALSLSLTACSNMHTEQNNQNQENTEDRSDDAELIKKPVLYLYPEEKLNVDVKVATNGKITTSYAKYKNGWHVIANPDGSMINKPDNQLYYYLFWEAELNTEYDMSKGFVVKGEDTENFLKEKLSYMGLSPREYNDFIVFWLPKMEKNPYNLISFQGETYNNAARLEINPKPDSILRVMMAYQKLNKPIKVPEQTLHKFERKGFAVVEWGGVEINK